MRLVVLSRLLSPQDFGLLGIALLVQNWVGSLTQTGISAALIHKKEDIQAYLNTAWSIQLIRGLVAGAFLFLVGPLGARFFDSPEAVPIIRMTGLLTVLWEFTNPAVVYFRMSLDFRKDAIWRLSGVVPGLVAAVVFALIYRNVWALMASLLASRVAEVAASYWIHPYRPRLGFEWHRARELMRFGKWLSWLNIGGFLERQLDSLMIGKVFGAVSLGYYQVAEQIAIFPTAKIGSYADALLFPAFCKVEDVGQIRRGYLSALQLLLLAVVPVGCLLSLFAEPLVRVALGPRWTVICPVLRILTWAGVATAVGSVIHSVFISSSRPQWSAAVQTLKVALLAGLLFPLSRYLGISGAALAVCIASVVSTSVQLVLTGRLMQAHLFETALTLKSAVLASLPLVVLRLLTPAGTWWVVLSLGIVATAIYVGVMLTTIRSQFGGRLVSLSKGRPTRMSSAA